MSNSTENEYTQLSKESNSGGKIRVNLLGFEASVDGLSVGVKTPFGQEAHVGIDGSIDESGKIAARAHAGAALGGDVKAATGLGGQISKTGTSANVFAATSAAGCQLGGLVAGEAKNGEINGTADVIGAGPCQNPQDNRGWSPKGVLNDFFNNFK